MGVCPTTREPCNCDRNVLYAGRLCWNLYRKKYNRKPYQNNPQVKQAYEQTEAAKLRRQRYQKRRRAVIKITNSKNLTEAFGNQGSLRKLSEALEAGNQDLVSVWSLLTPQQQELIKSAGSHLSSSK